MELAKSRGKKWAEIATILHRTEHNVKNRFHSLQIKTKKDAKRIIRPKLQPKHITTSI
jgi:DNA-binding NarL/FixJ family response regulator